MHVQRVVTFQARGRRQCFGLLKSRGTSSGAKAAATVARGSARTKRNATHMWRGAEALVCGPSPGVPAAQTLGRGWLF